MDRSEKIQDIQQRMDELVSEAEDEGLQVVVSWLEKSGGMRSVKLNEDDRIYVTVKQ